MGCGGEGGGGGQYEVIGLEFSIRWYLLLISSFKRNILCMTIKYSNK